jgi:hypothetical protein
VATTTAAMDKVMVFQVPGSPEKEAEAGEEWMLE